MATRLKTVEFAHPVLAALTDNTLTSLTQITVYLPESGKTFRKVVARVSAMGTATATGNITTRQLQCRLGAAGFTTHTQSNLYTGSGEDIMLFHEVDLTTHFTTNWSGTSMTFDSQVLIDGTATTIAWTNVCVTLYVTYDYDDTSATQIKTVRIPLNAPVAAFATTKPGTATATIPNLSTELPEASKVFRSSYITVQGNIALAAAVTDCTITMQLDTTASHTSGIFEGVSATDYWYRYVWDCSAVLTTGASMGFYIWGNNAKFNHSQAWLTVTYEFDATSSNDVFVSLLLPMELDSPMGGTTSADYQRATREVFIEEPGTITTKQIAFYSFWDQAAAISGLNMRVGTGAFVTYTDTAATVAGSLGAMTRNDAAFTLARGRNTLSFDIYRTDTADLGFNVSGFWILNYTAGKPTQGYGAANHTVFWNLGLTFDGAAAASHTTTAIAPVITVADYYMTALGTLCEYFTNTTSSPAGVAVLVERLAAEGGVTWESAYKDIGMTDPETGLHLCWSQMKDLFFRWPGDPGSGRMDLETARRWRTVQANASVSFDSLTLIMTLHGITKTVSGNITGSDGGTVTIRLLRQSTGELVASTTRSGNGAYSITWYDDTEPLMVEAHDATGNLALARDVYAA